MITIRSTLRRAVPAILALSISFLAGCAATGPTKQSRTYFDDTHAEVSKRSVVVIADGCFIRSEIGTSHVVAQASEQLGQRFANHVRDVVSKRGHQIKAVHAPFICGAFPQTFFSEFEIAANHGGDRQRINSHPILVTAREAAPEDPALIALLAAVQAAPVTVDSQESVVVQPIKLAMSDEEAAAVRQLTGADYAWVSLASGTQVSAGRQIGVGMLTGLVTGVLTGGASLVASFPVDTTVSQVALVKLDSQQLMWKRGLSVPALNLNVEPEKMHPFMGQLMVPFFPAPAAATP